MFSGNLSTPIVSSSSAYHPSNVYPVLVVVGIVVSVISSPAYPLMSFTSVPPFSINTIYAFTSVSVSFVGISVGVPSSFLPTKCAVFLILSVKPLFSITRTSKLKVVVPPFSATFTWIPFAKSLAVFVVKSTVTPFNV